MIFIKIMFICMCSAISFFIIERVPTASENIGDLSLLAILDFFCIMFTVQVFKA